ncbi:MAG: SLC13 family permease [Oscillospiraceae bacterium]|nr:SLC13 family permease [Oscillospiraceae bacterium]
MTAHKTSASKYAALAAGVLAFVATKLLPAPPGLPETGFQILGVLVSAIVLFLSWGTGWTSMAVVFALMTVPGVSVSQVTQATFGNSTVVFLLFCFMLASSLTESGAARRIAIWFLTNSLARKSPWWTVAMYFTAVYVLNLFLSAATCIMILMPILLSIFENVGLDKGRRCQLSSMLLLCTVVVSQLANGSNPISHAVTTQGFSLYESYTGEPMDFFLFCAIGTPISVVSSVVVYLLVRLVWKPDVSSFSGIDYDMLAASCGKVSKREKWSVAFYCACVVLWLLPGLSRYILPSVYPILSKISNCIPPLIALFLMNFITVDGEKILDWGDAVKAVNWPTFLFIASIMGLGSFMGEPEAGISEWLSQILSPVFSGVHPTVFLILMVLIVNVLTNFCSNSVALSAVYTVALPLCMSVYEGMLEPMLLSMLITSAAQNGWATAPATPAAAVAYASGWGDSKTILKWGMLILLIQMAIGLTLGSLLGSLLL